MFLNLVVNDHPNTNKNRYNLNLLTKSNLVVSNSNPLPNNNLTPNTKNQIIHGINKNTGLDSNMNPSNLESSKTSNKTSNNIKEESIIPLIKIEKDQSNNRIEL